MTDEAFATKAGVQGNTIKSRGSRFNKIKRGESVPSLREVKRICEAAYEPEWWRFLAIALRGGKTTDDDYEDRRWYKASKNYPKLLSKAEEYPYDLQRRLDSPARCLHLGDPDKPALDFQTITFLFQLTEEEDLGKFDIYIKRLVKDGRLGWVPDKSWRYEESFGFPFGFEPKVKGKRKKRKESHLVIQYSPREKKKWESKYLKRRHIRLHISEIDYRGEWDTTARELLDEIRDLGTVEKVISRFDINTDYAADLSTFDLRVPNVPLTKIYRSNKDVPQSYQGPFAMYSNQDKPLRPDGTRFEYRWRPKVGWVKEKGKPKSKAAMPTHRLAEFGNPYRGIQHFDLRTDGIYYRDLVRLVERAGRIGVRHLEVEHKVDSSRKVNAVFDRLEVKAEDNHNHPEHIFDRCFQAAIRRLAKKLDVDPVTFFGTQSKKKRRTR